ncbi:hypothetical protein HMPREF3198_00537 [Winkia neuii]|nr:hypothetical protein HMPREF3198_00537 [Winkia neuii]
MTTCCRFKELDLGLQSYLTKAGICIRRLMDKLFTLAFRGPII